LLPFREETRFQPHTEKGKEPAEGVQAVNVKVVVLVNVVTVEVVVVV
jgi:hypothetical protein